MFLLKFSSKLTVAKFSYLFLIIWFSSTLKWPLLSWLMAFYLPALFLWASLLGFLHYFQPYHAANSKTPLILSPFSPDEGTNVLADHGPFRWFANLFSGSCLFASNVCAPAVEMLHLLCFGRQVTLFPWFVPGHSPSLLGSNPKVSLVSSPLPWNYLYSVERPTMLILPRSHNLYLTLSRLSNAIKVV